MRLNTYNKVVLLIVFFALIISGIVSASELDDFQEVAENRKLLLYLNEETSEVAVKRKQTGEVWYSNPPGNGSGEQLGIEYFDPSDAAQTMNNYDDSIEYGQFEFEEIEQGIKIDYDFGEEWTDDDYIPLMISAERMEENILSNLNEEERETILGQYNKITLRERKEDEEPISLSGIDVEELLGDYTLDYVDQEDTSDSDRKSLLRTLFTRMVEQESIEERSDIKFEYLEHLVDGEAYARKDSLKPWDREDLLKFIKKAGYTPEDAVVDHNENYIGPPERNVEVFNVSLEYILDERALIARVPMEDIEYPKKVYTTGDYIRGASGFYEGDDELTENFGRIGGERVTFPLYSIEVLPNFGSSPGETDGYLFLPDGSGGLVDTSEALGLNYQKEVFGEDKTIAPPEKDFLQDNILEEQIHLPVFGIKNQDKGFLGIIEEGASFSRINARLANSGSAHNKVFSDFIIQPFEEIEIAEVERAERSGGKYLNLYPDSLPREDIVLRYEFLENEESDYVGMAHKYQEYLREKGALKKLENEDSIPFTLELLGAVPVRYPVMGIPRTVAEPMTDYREMKTIVDDFNDQGIENINVRYSGWMWGGLEHIFPENPRLESNLGTEEEFKETINDLREKGVDLYPDVRFLEVFPRKGFSSRRDAAERLNRDTAYFDNTKGAERLYNLSASRLDSVLEGFLAGFSEYEVNHISLKDLGSVINSDYTDGDNYDSARSRKVIENGLDKLKNEAELDSLIEQGNSYALPYTKNITDMPLEASEYKLVSESVPFYQMVVHGYINYTGRPFNYADDRRHNVLKSIETGSYPNFKLSYESSRELKNTAYDYFHTTQYQDWLEEAVEIYHDVNDVLRQIQGQRMVDHQELEEGLVLTVYENDLGIVVNYNQQSKSFQDKEIAPESFELLELEGGYQ